MPGRAHTRLAPLVLVLAATLSACGGDAETDPPATSQTSTTDGDSVTVAVTREGDSFTFRKPAGKVELTILAIRYESD